MFEVSDSARLETEQAPYPVAFSVPGRIATIHFSIGEQVRQGDLLAELDTEQPRLQLAEERTRLDSIAPQVAGVDAQVAAEQRGILEARAGAGVGVAEARAKYEESKAAADFSEEQARRMETLGESGAISKSDLSRLRAEAKSKRAAAESLKLTASRIEQELPTAETERAGRIEKLQREKKALEGQKLTSAATIERLQHEIEQRRILSPVSGQVAEVAELKPGAVVREGERLATILPAGELKVVADFPPSALGRIHRDAPARLRLHGFPSTQYGSIPAVVTRVASEVRDGKIRVELAPAIDPASGIPAQHGLPGALEIAVEKVSPATLLLRAAKFISAPLRAGSG